MEAEEEAVFRQMFAVLVLLRNRLRNQSPRSASLLIEQADDAIDAAKRVSPSTGKAT
jgi:hypothetical protein